MSTRPPHTRFHTDARRRFRPGDPPEAPALEFAYLNGEVFDPADPFDLVTLRAYAACESVAGRPLVCVQLRGRGEPWPDLAVLTPEAGVEAGGVTGPMSTEVPANAIASRGPVGRGRRDTTRPEGLTLWQRHKWFVKAPADLDGDPSSYWPWITVDHPVNRGLEAASLALTLLSVLVFCLETLPRYRLDADGAERSHRPFQVIEAVCVALFTAEYLWRLFFADDKARFVRDWLNVVDLVAIVPFYLILAIEGSGVDGNSTDSLVVVRVLRLSRVSRIARVSRHSNALQDVARCMVATSDELALFFLMTSVAMVLFGSAIFFCEKDEPDTGFVSIPAGFWWAIVTMSTVGYGDLVPTTVQGQVVGGLCATMGVILLAIPAGVFISEFLRLHELRRESRVARDRLGDPTAQLTRQLAAAYELVRLMKTAPPTDAAAVTAGGGSIESDHDEGGGGGVAEVDATVYGLAEPPRSPRPRPVVVAVDGPAAAAPPPSLRVTAL